MAEFHSDNAYLASLVVSIYLIGYCVGPLFLAPLSELYGRVPIYNICNVLFVIFNIACAVAPNLGSLIVFRLLTGTAGSCPVTLGAGSIADMISHENRGLAMGAWVLGSLVGPIAGPLGKARCKVHKLSFLIIHSWWIFDTGKGLEMGLLAPQYRRWWSICT